MERTYIKDLVGKIGESVRIAGFVDIRRDHGKLIFIDFRDVTGKIQAVAVPSHEEAHEAAKKLRPEWVVSVSGKINKRPEKMINPDIQNGDIELEIESIEILSEAAELPFEKDTELNLDTHLDYLPLTLRTDKSKAIFKVQAHIVRAFREFLTGENFTEFQSPKLIGEDAEGGANVFSLEYFGNKANLAQSPQFYKQIMVAVFEKVFAIGNVYRAEKHSTSRHLNEYTSLDIEMGFIASHRDVMRVTNRLLVYIASELRKNCAEEFKLLGSPIPEVPKEIPAMKLREAQAIITKETGKDCMKEPDLDPEQERFLSEYAKNNFNSDFIFITHYPTSKRPMYAFEDPEDPNYTNSFDLLFRGVEIATGGQRINDYEKLVEKIKSKGLDPEKFSFYLQAFKYGMPPHGGFGMGLERLTAKLLGLHNIKEATLFPREINRIDNLLSK
jgi:nondiscriminating aspartyl-tRNA synthetase